MLYERNFRGRELKKKKKPRNSASEKEDGAQENK